MDDHRRAFVAESEEGITALNNSLLDLEVDPDDAAAMDEVFRTAHTLKGNAAALGYTAMSDLAHALEDLLEEVRAGRVAVSPELMDRLFEGVDRLEAMLDEVAESGQTDVDADDLAAALRGFDDGVDAPVADAPVPPVAADLAPAEGEGLYRARVALDEGGLLGVDAMFVLEAVDAAWLDTAVDPDREALEAGEFDGAFDLYVVDTDADAVAAGLDAVSQVEAVEVTILRAPGFDEPSSSDATDDATDAVVEAGEEGGDGDEEDATVIGGADPATPEPSPAGAGSSSGAGAPSDAGPPSGAESSSSRDSDGIASVRVDVDQLDELYGLVEQLVTSRIKLRREVETAGLDSGNLDELDKITGNLQNTVMDMRLVPLKRVVDPFPRLVRDLARDQDKRVAFEMRGTDIELDRTILTEIRDPLMHVLRNAVDHGIEPADERAAADKPAEGSVVLSATRERDHVTVEVRDDGRGLDADAIRAKAREKGVQTAAELEAMTDDEVYELVFHPGFSTAAEVTDVSGRGVGMDVVHTTVQQLDGTVSVDSDPGAGTTVRLRLPVTVAIVKVMFVEVAGTEYGVPVKNIAEVSRARDVRVVNGDEVVEHGDDIYPVVRLAEVLGERAVGAATGAAPAPAMDGGRREASVASEGDIPEPDISEVDAAGSGGADDGMLLRIRDDKRQVALHCDAVLDQEEVVVKPLEGVLSGIPGLSGTAVLGDGDVVAILDVVTL